MVLELKVPHGTEWETLRPLVPVFLTYVLSFVFLGIYWNNHHHMLQRVERFTPRALHPCHGIRISTRQESRLPSDAEQDAGEAVDHRRS